MSTEKPIEQEYEDNMRELARLIDFIFNAALQGEHRTTGWALLVFPFGDGDNRRTNYISNAERKDMLLAMKEFIARAEGRLKDGEEIQ